MNQTRANFSLKALFWSFTLGAVFAFAVSAGVALWITKAPIPFVAKVQQGSKLVDITMDGKQDPNQNLYAEGQGVELNTAKVATVKAGDAAAEEDSAVPVKYWVQTGAFSQNVDAESMRARIAFIGLDAQIVYRNERGQRLYRVRIGPFETQEQAEEIKQTLADNSIKGELLRLRD